MKYMSIFDIYNFWFLIQSNFYLHESWCWHSLLLDMFHWRKLIQWGKAMVHCLGWYMMTPVSLVPLNSSVHEYHEFSRSLVQNYPSCFLGQRPEREVVQRSYIVNHNPASRRILLLCWPSWAAWVSGGVLQIPAHGMMSRLNDGMANDFHDIVVC